MAERMTYLLVDGENIDATLGTSILGRRPRPEERPRWDRLLRVGRAGVGPARHRAVLPRGQRPSCPTSFVQALLAIGFRPIPLRRRRQEVVDIAIQRTAEALVHREADVVLVSHDGDFVDQVSALLRRQPPGRRHRVHRVRELAVPQPAGPADLRPRVRPRRLQLAAAAHARDPDRRVRPARLPLRSEASQGTRAAHNADGDGEDAEQRRRTGPPGDRALLVRVAPAALSSRPPTDGRRWPGPVPSP